MGPSTRYGNKIAEYNIVQADSDDEQMMQETQEFDPLDTSSISVPNPNTGTPLILPPHLQVRVTPQVSQAPQANLISQPIQINTPIYGLNSGVLNNAGVPNYIMTTNTSPMINPTQQNINLVPQITQLVNLVMMLNRKVDQLTMDMKQVRAYIDMEKDMIPVLIQNKQNDPAATTTATGPVPVAEQPIFASPFPPLAPINNNNTTISKTTKKGACKPFTIPLGLPSSGAGKKTTPMISRPVKKVTTTPIVIEDDPPIVVVRSEDNSDLPPMFDDFDEETISVIEETVANDATAPNIWRNFHVKDVEDFKLKNDVLQGNENFRRQLKELFTNNIAKKSDIFTKWFSDKFLDVVVWTQQPSMKRSDICVFSKTPISDALEEAWKEKIGSHGFPDFVRLQLYNAKTRVAKERLLGPGGKRPADTPTSTSGRSWEDIMKKAKVS